MNTALIVAGAAALVVYLAGRKVAKRDSSSEPGMGGGYGGGDGAATGGGGGGGGGGLAIAPMVGGIAPIVEPEFEVSDKTMTPMGEREPTLLESTVAALNLGSSGMSTNAGVVPKSASVAGPSVAFNASTATATPLTESAAPVSATVDRYTSPTVTSVAVAATPIRTDSVKVAQLSAAMTPVVQATPVAMPVVQPTKQSLSLALAAFSPKVTR